MKIIGPFAQVVTLDRLPLQGSIPDRALEIRADSAVAVDKGKIAAVDTWDRLIKKYPTTKIERVKGARVLLPGFIDSHTHICFAGNRANDYALRVSGKPYLEIAAAGGGIWDSVTQTREVTGAELTRLTAERADRHLQQGITTIEVKSGYGLNTRDELKMLRSVQDAGKMTRASLISTCLAAHIKPRDFAGDNTAYLQHIAQYLLPVIRKEGLSGRVDIFIDPSAFSETEAKVYLATAKNLGFAITVHADQFTTGGSAVAVASGAVSADHLEACGHEEIRVLAKSGVVATVLPGASLGLGMSYAPARKLLDAGACLAIASDWNPGSAPMGDLLMEACVMGAYEKLSIAETVAGLTIRAAKALGLTDRGILKENYLADMQAYPVEDFREIFYLQGSLKPSEVWKNGKKI